MNKNITNLAEDLDRIINSEVNNRISHMKLVSYEELFNRCLEDIQDLIKETRKDIQDLSESNLSINRIEQEGYLRCLINTESNMLYNKKYMIDDSNDE